jgi:galactitol-specific phosphotransferase system IIC component
MTGRHTGRDRFRTTPAHCAGVLLGVLVTIAVVIGTAAGLRAGLTAAGLLLGIPAAGALVLIGLCLIADAARTARHRRAWRRAGLDGPVDVVGTEDQALAHLTRRLDQEA